MFPGLIIRASSYVFGSVLGKFYTKEKLADLVEIKVSSEPSGIIVNCSDLSDLSVWLEIVNSSPFNIHIEEIEGDFYFPDRVAGFVKICKMDIAHKEVGRLFIRTDLNEKQAAYIKKHKSDETPLLKINALLSCRISSFEIKDREITTQNIDFIECDDSWIKFIPLPNKPPSNKLIAGLDQ